MSHSPLVSVLMNCFNGERFIGHAIESVLAQTYTNFEIVVWDNQSIDKSAEIVESFGDSRIVYRYAEEHTTLAEGRRRAFEHLRGEWIAILDVDDLWRPTKLERQVQLAEKNTDCGFVYCATNVLTETTVEGAFDDHVFKRFSDNLPNGNIYAELLRGNFISTASLLINRSRLAQLGGFSGRYPIMEDYYVTLNLSYHYPVAAVQEVLCDYRIHGGNDSLRDPLDHFEDLAIIKRLFPDRGAIFSAARIIVRHIKKCIRYRSPPQFGSIGRALAGTLY